MTEDQAKSVARFIRRQANSLPYAADIEFASHLREAADIIEVADSLQPLHSPSHPAAVEPQCRHCRWWVRNDHCTGTCHCNPLDIRKDEYDWCREFSKREVTK